MIDRAERGERLAHGRLVCHVEGDALRVDVGALGIAAEDHDVPPGVDGEPRRRQADAGRAPDECRPHAAIIAKRVSRSPRSTEQRAARRPHRLSATLHTIERWVPGLR